MGKHASDAEGAQFDQRSPQHGIDEENMLRIIRRQRARQPLGAGHHGRSPNWNAGVVSSPTKTAIAMRPGSGSQWSS